MIKHGVFYCRYCAYRCPVKLAPSERQRENVGCPTEDAFFALVEDRSVGIFDLDRLDQPPAGSADPE